MKTIRAWLGSRLISLGLLIYPEEFIEVIPWEEWEDDIAD